MTCGIYVLYYETDDFQYYIGKSIDIENRYKQHCRQLKHSTHHSRMLQQLFIKYSCLPTVATLEILPANNTILLVKETEWILRFDSFHNGMNGTPGGQGMGYGEDHPTCNYTNKEIINLVHCILDNPSVSLNQIAMRLGMSPSVVHAIAHGTDHSWLVDIIPIEYSRLLSLNKIRSYIRSDSDGKAYKSKYTKDIIIQVLIMYVSGASILSIVDTTKVPREVIDKIVTGQNHKWLEYEFPKEYIKMLEMKRLSIVIPNIISPEGIVYQISNRELFSIEHCLDPSALSKVLNGKRPHHKGWRLA